MKIARIATLSVLFASPALAQLAPPPGPVTDTDRVREQADARTPISTGFFTIDEPGSYYLTQNISSIVVAAIVIDAPDVTLDLNGFSIDGGIGGINVNADRVTIRNGKIRNTQGEGIDGRSADQLVIEDITIENCGRGTILVPENDSAINIRSGRVERTRIIDCPSGIGFFSDDTMVKDCVLEDIDGSGINSRGAANFGVFVEGCTLRNIGFRGIDASDHTRVRNTTIESTGDAGIDIQRDGLVENVTVIDAGGFGIIAGRNGRVIASTAIDAGSTGISVGRSGLITGCTVAGAGNTGYIVGQGGLIRDSAVNGRARNGTLPTAIGIELGENATARGNAIFEYQESGITMEADAVADSNTIRGNESSGSTDRAFFVSGAFTQITRNNVSLSGVSSIAPGTSGSWIQATSVALLNGSRIGPANDLDSPWANFVD